MDIYLYLDTLSILIQGNCFNTVKCALNLGFPGGSEVKESACQWGDPGSVPGSGRHPGEEDGCLFRYSCPGNPMARGVWQATVHRSQRDTT